MIRLSKSCLSQREELAVIEVLRREFLGMGKEVKRFEEELEKFFESPVVCVASGTAALQLSCQAIGLKVGDEVLVPTITYVATFQAISATGATPVPCDVTKDNACICVNDMRKRLSSKTRAIMPVHYSGSYGNIAEVYQFAKEYGLRVIEDAAHAFGTSYNGRKIGSIGDVICFSFDGIKNITSGEGGCVVTKDEFVLQKVKDDRLLGVEKDTENRFRGNRSWEFNVVNQGWRYHMSDIMAAIGVVQLSRFPEFKIKRQELAKLYDDILAGVNYITTFSNDYNEVVPYIYVVKLKSQSMRDWLRERLLQYEIETGVHYKPNHLLSFYNSHMKYPFENSDFLAGRLLSLPLHPDVEKEDVEFVCSKVEQLLYEWEEASDG